MKSQKHKKLNAEAEKHKTDSRKARVNGHNVIFWNTGRSYTIMGQKIVAVKHMAGAIFFDLTRDIYGVIEVCEFTSEYIMHQYDANEYKGIRTQAAYCIQKDLCVPRPGILSMFELFRED